MSKPISILDVPVLTATRENAEACGLFIGTAVPSAGLPIPFYRGAVEEGRNIPFECHERAVIRTARISRRGGEVRWLERHQRMTQLFVGLGDQPFAMVLGPPSPEGVAGPDLSAARCFVFPPGHGILLRKGTWHDFPLSVRAPVTCLTANSAEVVEALAAMQEPAEMDHGDVFKLDLAARYGTVLRVSYEGTEHG